MYFNNLPKRLRHFLGRELEKRTREALSRTGLAVAMSTGEAWRLPLAKTFPSPLLGELHRVRAMAIDITALGRESHTHHVAVPGKVGLIKFIA